MLREEIALGEEKPVTWVFMLRQEPVLAQNAAILGEQQLRLTWDEPLTPQAERIDITDGRMRRSYPGALWRLTLTAPCRRLHRVTFSLEA